MRSDEPAGTALARCVAGSARAFAEEHWGRAPRLTRAAELPADFGDLLGPADVDELVSRRGLRTPFARMAKDGAVRPAASFTRGGGAGATIADQVADDKVLAALAGGSTLVLQGLHRTWPPLVDFGSRLAEELGHPVQINAYVTPPQSQGFAPHHDVHDVFVLQVSGHKHWTVHEPVVADPLADQPFTAFAAEIAERTAQPPVIDTLLAPGDALYLPRGTVHAAQAQGETSIHLTVGVHPLTRYDIVRALLGAVQDDPQLRASLPARVDLGDPAVLADDLSATVDALHAAVDAVPAARVADALAATLRQKTRPQPIAPLAQLAAAGTVAADTLLRRRGGLRARLRDDGIGLELLDRTVDLPAGTTDAVALVLAGAVFTPAGLPGLDAADGVALAAQLLRESVVVPA